MSTTMLVVVAVGVMLAYIPDRWKKRSTRLKLSIACLGWRTHDRKHLTALSENVRKTFMVGVTYFVRSSLAILGLTECGDLLSKDGEDSLELESFAFSGHRLNCVS
jgi:hypothetical protein